MQGVKRSAAAGLPHHHVDERSVALLAHVVQPRWSQAAGQQSEPDEPGGAPAQRRSQSLRAAKVARLGAPRPLGEAEGRLRPCSTDACPRPVPNSALLGAGATESLLGQPPGRAWSCPLGHSKAWFAGPLHPLWPVPLSGGSSGECLQY